MRTARSDLVGLPVAVTLALLATPAAAQDPARFEAADALQGLSELGETGLPLWRQLFSRGWPTDAAHREATLGTAQLVFERGLEAYLASGAGVPLSSTAYQEERFKRHQNAGGNLPDHERLLRHQLNVYKTLSGAATLSVPPGFDPVAVPYQQASAKLDRAWSQTDVATWRWKTQQQSRHTLDAFGFAMLAELRFARQHLAHVRTEQQAGKTVTYYGRTPEEGFFAFIALHCAIAKLHEIRQVIIDQNNQTLIARPNGLAGVNELSYNFPTAWSSAFQAGKRATYALDNGPLKLSSELDGAAALLLAASELAALCDPDVPANKPLHTLLFSQRPMEGMPPEPLFESNTLDAAHELALFTFKSMRTIHVDVMQGGAATVADTNERGLTVTARDLSLFLMSVQAFREQVKLPAPRAGAPPNARANDLTEETKKAEVLVRTLCDGGLMAWEQGAAGAGIADVYALGSNARRGSASLHTQAFAIRGLLVTHRVANGGGGGSTQYLEAAERIARWLDRERWDPAVGAYVDKGQQGQPAKASVLGAIAVVGALRELALATNDGRYLARMRQHLETMTRCGLVRVEGGALPPGLTAEVPITPK